MQWFYECLLFGPSELFVFLIEWFYQSFVLVRHQASRRTAALWAVLGPSGNQVDGLPLGRAWAALWVEFCRLPKLRGGKGGVSIHEADWAVRGEDREKDDPRVHLNVHTDLERHLQQFDGRCGGFYSWSDERSRAFNGGGFLFDKIDKIQDYWVIWNSLCPLHTGFFFTLRILKVKNYLCSILSLCLCVCVCVRLISIVALFCVRVWGTFIVALFVREWMCAYVQNHWVYVRLSSYFVATAFL